MIRPRISRFANTPLAVPPSPVRTVVPVADDRVAGLGVAGDGQREAVGVDRGARLEEQIAHRDVGVSRGTTVVAAEM